MGSPMSPVDFKKWPCPLSLFLRFPCPFFNGPISPVDFKKWGCPLLLVLTFSWRFSHGTMSPVDFKIMPCRPVKFKGQGPKEGNKSTSNALLLSLISSC